MPSSWRSVQFIGWTSLLCGVPGLLAFAEPDIGVFTAVEGKVSVQHAQSPEALSAKLSDTVLFRDLIETQKESRTKALLNDDSILTVGEHSRVEITEHIYDPKSGVRSVVVNLVQGRVRALVGMVFEGSGSKFEVHTPTAVAAARGTYFVVWHVDGASGIANIGSHGNVDFQSGGQTVNVIPGNYSLTPPGGGPPSLPQPAIGGNAPAQVTAAVQGTDVKESINEPPGHAALASGGTAPIQSPSAGANVSAASSRAISGTTSPTSASSSTPPAVTSGAVSGAAGGGDGSTGGGTTSSDGYTGSDSGIASGGNTPPPNRGLHLGQLGLQPGFGFPAPGNIIIPPAVISGAFTPPGRGGTPPGRGGSPGGPPGKKGP